MPSLGTVAVILKKVLGSLELEIMELMWLEMEATARQITIAINRKRPIAYTTVTTVMGHLVEKKLLLRVKERQRYQYKATTNKDELLREIFKSKFRTIVEDFGDLATEWLREEIGIYQ